MNRERQKMETFLQQLPAGRVAQTRQLESAMASCWHTILGGDAGGMDGYKLRDRMEQPRWEPPILKFRVERHGSTVCGSTRAEIQQWEIDTNRCQFHRGRPSATQKNGSARGCQAVGRRGLRIDP